MSRLREQKYWSGLYFTEEEPCKTVCFSPHIFLVYLQISFTLKSRIYEPYQDIRLYERSLTVYTLLFKFVTNEKKKNAKVKSIHNCFLPFDSITIIRKDFGGQAR